MTSYLVTGAAGFIGSNFVRHLLGTDEDATVVSLDALATGGKRSNLGDVLEHPRHEFVEGGICDGTLVGELLDDIDIVVNFAAESHVDRAIDEPSSFVATNVGGTQTLLDAARQTGIETFVQMSTDEVYGQILDGQFTTDDCLNPRNPYAATKAGADHLATSYYTTYDLPVVIPRASNNYGPRQHTEKLIPKFIQRAAAGKSLPLYGDGSNVREWIYVTDTCRAITTVIQQGAPGKVYNIGSGIERSNREITDRILAAVGASDELIELVEDRPGHDQRYALDTSKIESLGWKPTVSFEEGLERTVDYYLE